MEVFLSAVFAAWTYIHDKLLYGKPRYFYRYFSEIYENKNKTDNTNHAESKVYSININNAKTAEKWLKIRKKTLQMRFLCDKI